MKRRLRWSLRARLVVAFVGVAVLAADMATVYTSLNLNSPVTVAARSRLQHSARHYGTVAGTLYANGGWTSSAVTALRHLAEIDDLAVKVVDTAGSSVLSLPANGAIQPGASASAPITASGRRVGTVTVSQADGQLLTAEEVRLREGLDHTNLVAGLASAAVATAIALYLALTLSRPLRRIRTSAEAMASGDLEARVEEAGDNELRSVAHALNRLAESLQHEEELRKTSVADLAHELRTPVMGLLGRIEAAQDDVLEDRTANLAAMHNETSRLTRLLDDLSALAEAERPGLLLTLEPVDLATVAVAQLHAFNHSFAAKGILLTDDLQSTFVSGDAKRLAQIVVNLLSNALRYTDAGGKVTVTVRQVGEEAVLEVADTGIGIPAADLPHVFSRFWRGDASRSRATGGAGIGLAIVRELAFAHGGRVTVDSTELQGSVFRVAIPVSPTAVSR